jgi:hypothetical protein
VVVECLYADVPLERCSLTGFGEPPAAVLDAGGGEEMDRQPGAPEGRAAVAESLTRAYSKIAATPLHGTPSPPVPLLTWDGPGMTVLLGDKQRFAVETGEEDRRLRRVDLWARRAVTDLRRHHGFR